MTGENIEKSLLAPGVPVADDIEASSPGAADGHVQKVGGLGREAPRTGAPGVAAEAARSSATTATSTGAASGSPVRCATG